jgi:hypothetical protein
VVGGELTLLFDGAARYESRLYIGRRLFKVDIEPAREAASVDHRAIHDKAELRGEVPDRGARNIDASDRGARAGRSLSARDEGDNASRESFERLLKDEEAHVDCLGAP